MRKGKGKGKEEGRGGEEKGEKGGRWKEIINLYHKKWFFSLLYRLIILLLFFQDRLLRFWKSRGGKRGRREE